MKATVDGSGTSRRQPAEWEPHRATWLSWPHPDGQAYPGDWARRAGEELAAAVAVLIEGEEVWINVRDDGHEALARQALGDLRASARVHFHRIPTDEPWCRDHGPTFLLAGNTGRELAAVDWVYNAWGEKYQGWERDAEAGRLMVDVVGVDVATTRMVCEGGLFDTDGRGTLMASEECLRSHGRNPAWSRGELEGEFRRLLGVNRFLWVSGSLVGDDTSGHIDVLARFVPGEAIVYGRAGSGDPENVRGLGLLERTLKEEAVPLGYTLVPVPMPDPVFEEGERLPATYLNFYVANSAVLVPVFGKPQDKEAVEVIGRCFGDRPVVPIKANALAWAFGTLHCLTQQVPATPSGVVGCA